MLFAKVVWAAGEIKPIGPPDGNFEKDDKKIYINLINLDAGLQWFSVRFVRGANIHPARVRRSAANDCFEPTAVVRKSDEHDQEYSSSINRRAPGNRRIVFYQTLKGR